MTLVERLRRQRLDNERLLPWRDYQHVGQMFQGQCFLCYGWVDDPRHTSFVVRFTRRIS